MFAFSFLAYIFLHGSEVLMRDRRSIVYPRVITQIGARASKVVKWSCILVGKETFSNCSYRPLSTSLFVLSCINSPQPFFKSQFSFESAVGISKIKRHGAASSVEGCGPRRVWSFILAGSDVFQPLRNKVLFHVSNVKETVCITYFLKCQLIKIKPIRCILGTGRGSSTL